jgi:aspartate aminotransferase-like enzyme
MVNLRILMEAVIDNTKTIIQTDNDEFLLTGAGTWGWRRP